MPEKKQKPKIHNVIIDAEGKCKGMTDFQVGTLDATYHMLEDLCVSAHSITLIKDFMPRLSKQEKDEIVRTVTKIGALLPAKKPMLRFVMMHMSYVNTYANLFDSGLSALFNQIKMDREGIMYGVQKTMMEQEGTADTPPKKPIDKEPRNLEVA
jgi:hypothetical protein